VVIEFARTHNELQCRLLKEVLGRGVAREGVGGKWDTEIVMRMFFWRNAPENNLGMVLQMCGYDGFTKWLGKMERDELFVEGMKKLTGIQ